MTGYTRQSATDIVDGLTVEAQPINDEFNMLQSAFSASTGHAHDGSVGGGAPITSAGPSLDVNFGATALYPRLNNVVDLGTTALKFKNLYLAGNIILPSGSPLALTEIVTTNTAQTISAVKTLSANLSLNNNVSVLTRLADTTAINLLSVNAADELTLGDEGVTIAGVHANELFEVFVADHLDSSFWVNAVGPAGDGSQFTNLNGSNIATGTVADARLPATVVRTSRTLTAGAGVAAIGDLSADRTIALTGQALSFHNLATSGFAVRTPSGVVGRSLQAGTGMIVSGGDGQSGDPTLTVDTTVVTPVTRTLTGGIGIAPIGNLSVDRTIDLEGQALALHNLSSNGIIARTAADTVAARTITSGSGITVGDGDGVAGNPTVSLTGQALAFHTLGTNGFAVRTSAGTVAARSVQPGDGISVTNSDGVSGDPTVAVDGTVVRTSGAQTIGGTKEFTGQLRLSNNIQLLGYLADGVTTRQIARINSSDITEIGSLNNTLTMFSSGNLVINVAGVNIMTLKNNEIEGVQFRATGTGANYIAATDSAAAPSFTWTSYSGMGMYRASSTAIGFAVGGTESGRINGTGFSGDGSQLSNLSASNLATGTVPSARLNIATQAEAEGGSNNTALMTPLRTAQYYTVRRDADADHSTSTSDTTAPVGSYLLVRCSAAPARNSSFAVHLATSVNYTYVNGGHTDAGTEVGGTWRARGTFFNSSGDHVVLAQRVA